MFETERDLRPAEVSPTECPLEIQRSEESSWEFHMTCVSLSEVVRIPSFTDALKQRERKQETKLEREGGGEGRGAAAEEE